MFKIKSSTRLALTLGVGCASLVWLAVGMGIVPDPNQKEVENRIALAKSIAVNVTTFAENKRVSDLETILSRNVEAESTLHSIGVRRLGRTNYLIATGGHEEQWVANLGKDPGRQVEVSILANGKNWGVLEVAFAPFKTPEIFSFLVFPFGLVAFVSASMTLMSWVVLGKTFKYLNPSKVVPDRVRSALDTLAEGLVLVSPTGEIAHVNQAFANIIERDDDDIIGSKLDDFEWEGDTDTLGYEFPWVVCQTDKRQVCGEIVQLRTANQPSRKYVVNAAPIKGTNETIRGALISFDDVTAIENKNAELGRMIQTLRSSRDEVERQNEKLNFLASYDPLTKCMNRRAFFGKFESHWEDKGLRELAIMMLDIDHFKAVNDNHGHSVGDEVLKAMGDLLRDQIGSSGLVCRYGGEEFVVLVPDVEFVECMQIAEDLRKRIEQTEASGVRFTASIGISSRNFGSMDPQHMLDQADESLYIAKRNGRNQVVRFDERSNFVGVETVEEEEDVKKEIPYSAVTGLLSALSFRCQATAQHSIRVADLCVAIGEQMLGSRDLYRLEVAALLHDIGKIGVPDSILNKPGPLTAEESKVMRKHDQIGIEIVRSAFGSESIASVIESHHYCHEQRLEPHDQSIDNDSIPLAGRIITVCDAFDSMTTNQVYRAAISEYDALEEIVRHTPKQFDAEVVTQLVIHMQNGHRLKNKPVEVVSTGHEMIGQHIESLYAAIAEQDVSGIRAVVECLKRDAVNQEGVSNATERLDEAINTDVGDLEKVLSLANEVMEVCRAQRSRVVSSGQGTDLALASEGDSDEA